jgi:transglutaminase-like putative cysteine protease/Tfp pilus assembly protein PilF
LPVSAQEPAITSTVAQLQSDAGAPQDLIEMARAAAESDHRNAAWLETLGQLERDHGRGPALEQLEAAAHSAPSAERWLAVAQACGEATCGFSAFNAALRAEPQNVAAHIALADYYFARGQKEKGRDLLRQAVRLQPQNFVARKRLADLYVSVGLNALALAEYEKLEHEFPGPVWLKRELASRYQDLGLHSRAEALLRSGLRTNFDGGQERALLVRILERRHDRAGLRDAYTDMARLRPTDVQPLIQLAELAAGMGDVAAAEKTLRAALDIDPESAELHARFGELLSASGRAHAARVELARAVELNPHLHNVRRRLEAAAATLTNDETEYLADARELAAAVQRGAPNEQTSAVMLADVRVERVYENGLSAARVQQVYYIASEQGARDFTTRAIQYSPVSQELHILHARVHKPDGRILEADEAGETSNADANIAMYYDVRSRSLRFPVEKGDVIEMDYRISPNSNVNPYGDYFGTLVVFGSQTPQRMKRYVLITPARRKFNVLEARLPAPAAVSLRGSERVYRWDAQDLPPLANEPRGPAVTEVAPYVHVSTFSSWQDIGRWYAQLVRPQFALDSNLRAALGKIVAGKKTKIQKINAIHQFVLRNTHYVALEFGIYSYKPYPVSQVYARRFGDCKDKAGLMIALLRAAGIEAEIALVRTRRMGEVGERATSISVFNHAIVYVPAFDMWLDGTAEYAGSRELPLEDQGAMALTVSAGGDAELRRVPVTKPSDNYTRRTVVARVQPDGSMQFSGSAYIRGEDAPGLRREYEVAERQRESVRNTLSEIFPSVHVEDVTVQAEDLEHDVMVNFRGALDTFRGKRALSLSASWMPRSYVQKLAPLATRTQDLLLPAPWTTEEELHFVLPTGASAGFVPRDKTLQTQFGSATLKYERRGRELVVRTSVQFRKLRIRPDEYPAFRDFCGQVERAFREEIKVALGG